MKRGGEKNHLFKSLQTKLTNLLHGSQIAELQQELDVLKARVNTLEETNKLHEEQLSKMCDGLKGVYGLTESIIHINSQF